VYKWMHSPYADPAGYTVPGLQTGRRADMQKKMKML